MVALILDSNLQNDLIRARRESGADRYDEVWDGVYVMSPAPDPQHQGIGGKLYIVFDEVIESDGLGDAHFGVNVTDRFEEWAKNYRVPDLTVYLHGNPVEHSGPAFVGGPDFLVEIRSDDDRTWEKLPFFANLNVREILIVERDPWKLTLLRLVEGTYTEVGTSTPESGAALRSEVIPLTFRLGRNPAGAVTIEIRHDDGRRAWTIEPREDKAAMTRHTERP